MSINLPRQASESMDVDEVKDYLPNLMQQLTGQITRQTNGDPSDPARAFMNMDPDKQFELISALGDYSVATDHSRNNQQTDPSPQRWWCTKCLCRAFESKPADDFVCGYENTKLSESALKEAIHEELIVFGVPACLKDIPRENLFETLKHQVMTDVRLRQNYMAKYDLFDRWICDGREFVRRRAPTREQQMAIADDEYKFISEAVELEEATRSSSTTSLADDIIASRKRRHSTTISNNKRHVNSRRANRRK